jgi:ribosomal protein S18
MLNAIRKFTNAYFELGFFANAYTPHSHVDTKQQNRNVFNFLCTESNGADFYKKISELLQKFVTDVAKVNPQEVSEI